METSAASTKGSLRELLNCWRKPLIVSTSLAVSQQLTGNAVILNYTAEIFRMAGVVGSVHTVVLGGVKVLATVIAIIKVCLLDVCQEAGLLTRLPMSQKAAKAHISQRLAFIRSLNIYLHDGQDFPYVSCLLFPCCSSRGNEDLIDRLWLQS